MQHIVLRLADAVPAQLLAALERAPADIRWDAVETVLDQGRGTRHLADPRIAEVVVDALTHFDGVRYRLQAWCVMPTHVHVLAEQVEGWTLARFVHGWKSFTAKRANAMLGRTGPFWAAEYFDRAMRSDAQAQAALAYIEYNPVVAKLCESIEGWPWSSACPERGRLARDVLK